MSINFVISLLYFVGLVMLGASVGSYTGVPEFAFMLIGGGTITFTWYLDYKGNKL